MEPGEQVLDIDHFNAKEKFIIERKANTSTKPKNDTKDIVSTNKIIMQCCSDFEKTHGTVRKDVCQKT